MKRLILQTLPLFLLLIISPSTRAETFRVTKKITKSGSSSATQSNSKWLLDQLIPTRISASSSLRKPRKEASGEARLLRSGPYFIAHDSDDLDARFEEWELSLESLPTELQQYATRIQEQISQSQMAIQTDSDDVRTLVDQGPSDSRIDLTFIGDGYTIEERDKFFEDVEFMISGLFESRSFSSYLPLFNVHAVFVPSRESGLGDGSPKDTAFRLYRTPRGSKRGIRPGNERAMTQAINRARDTDYPIVIANDDFYGGLGGRWAITTRSRTSGLKVLRHELGHNFGEVGEEYDNGYVYEGANSSRSTRVSWRNWLEGALESHEATLLTGDYVWKNLKEGSYRARFTTPSNGHFLEFVLSSVGWSTPNDVEVLLNGEAFTPEGIFQEDRSFFRELQRDIAPNTAFTLEAREKVQDQDNVLGFALAYSMPESYDFTKDKVGAFATYNSWGRKSYRPTHDSCLMRDMNTDKFCVVDRENMWFKFLRRTGLIDEVIVNDNVAALRTPQLDGLEIRWEQKTGWNWVAIPDSDNLTEVMLPSGSSEFRVRVTFANEEVRKSDDSLSSTFNFQI